MKKRENWSFSTMYFICESQSKAHYQHQNPAERCIQDVNWVTNMIWTMLPVLLTGGFCACCMLSNFSIFPSIQRGIFPQLSSPVKSLTFLLTLTIIFGKRYSLKTLMIVKGWLIGVGHLINRAISYLPCPPLQY